MQLLNDQTKSANQHSLKSERKSVNTVLNAIWDNGYGGNIIWCSE